MILPSDQKKLKELVKRRHPRYDEMLPHWEFLQACYEGGRAWFEENIFQYIKEGEKEFADRQKRAYRFNHSREVVDLVNKYIFKGEVKRSQDDAPNSVKQFWEKATRNGQPIQSFMQQVCRRSSTVGRIWICVDNNVPQVGEGEAPVSIADEKKLDLRTYAYIIMPQDVLDMSYDADGKLNWILLRELYRDDEDPIESSGKVSYRYRLWTRTHWVLLSEVKKGNTVVIEEIENGEHSLGEVPVFCVDHLETDELYSSPALINDIAYLDRAIANYLSNLDAIIQDQTFSQLVLPAQGLLAMGVPGHDDADEKGAMATLLEMGTKRIFTYNAEGGQAPQYISPDPAQAQIIVTVIRQIINEIYHTVGMAGERTKQDNSMGIDNSSGVAKAYDFERVNALLTAKADALDRAETNISRLVCLWNGETLTKEDLVKYPDSFDVRGLTDEFDIAQRLSLLNAPDTVRQEQMKMLVDKLFPQLSEELKARIKADIEKWPPEPVEMNPAPTLNGGAPAESKAGSESDEEEAE